MTESQKIALRLPNYDRAYQTFLQEVVHGFAASDNVIGDIDYVSDPHSGPIRNVRGEKPLDQPMKQLSAMLSLEKEAIRTTNVDGHTMAVTKFAQELIGEQTKLMFQNMAEMTTAAGTMVANEGNGVPTIEQMRELFKKMEFSFDDDGRISGLKLFVDPSQLERAKDLMRQAEEDPECRQIILEKRAEWLKVRAERSHRTLS